jgi:tRNA(adenine34) deaminase
MWSELDKPWQACLELAWEAYCDDCIPIGVVVMDSAGNILARGRNRVYPRSRMGDHMRGVEIAHAEVEAMQNLDYSGLDPHTCTLCTTTEPCPMCMGTFYMSGLRGLNYAARDPWAGSVNLLGKTWYLDLKPIKVNGPDEMLEPILVALFVEQELRFHAGQLPQGWFWEMYADAIPAGIVLGRRLYGQPEWNKKMLNDVPASKAFDDLILLIN